MKYIKLFEDVNNVYEEITASVFYSNSFIMFPDSINERLKKFCSIPKNYHTMQYLSINHSIAYYPIDCIKAKIFLCDDEWYYVISLKREKIDDTRYRPFVEYFRCDQWEGLMNCLKKEVDLEENIFHI